MPYALIPLLNEQLGCLQQLLEALKQEQQALLHYDTAALDQAVKAKTRLLTQTRRLDGERTALLSAAGLTDTRAGMESLIAAEEDADTAAACWTKLLDLAAESRERNRLNGGIVELSLHHLQRSLNVLRGQAPESPVYGPGGRTANGVSSRSLARA